MPRRKKSMLAPRDNVPFLIYETRDNVCYERHDYREFISFVESAPVEWGDCRDRPAKGDGGGDDWDNGDSFEQCKQFARYGWPQGRDNVQDVSARLPHVGLMRTGRVSHHHVGARPNVQQFLKGNPECMVQVTKSRKRPVAHIRVCAVYHCMVTNTQLANWCVGLLSLIDSLEGRGLQTSLTAGYPIATDRTGKGSPVWELDINVKDPGQPLDLDRMAFVFGHPGMLRRYVLGYMDSHQERFEALFGYGHGYPEPELDAQSADIVIDSVQAHLETANDLAKCVEFFVRAGEVLGDDYR